MRPTPARRPPHPRLLALLALVAFCAAARGAAARQAVEGAAPVVVVPIRGELNESMVTLTLRAIDTAHARQARALIFEIDSEGGSIELMDRLIDEIERASDLTTVAFVTQKAASAGALIAISCERLYMKPATNIGSAVPILLPSFGNGGAPPLLSRDLPAEFEKILSHLRAHFRAKAQARGRNPALAEAMVDPNTDVFEIELDGVRTFASQKEFEEHVAEKGEASVRKVREVCPRGTVLNLTAQEAQSFGFIDGIAATREDLLGQLALASAPVLVIAPSWTDRLAQFTRNFGWLLVGVGLVALFIELKVPGFGLPGLLGIACLAVYLVGNYIAGVADWGEILLVLLGFALVAVEVFALPGTMLPGLLGLIAVVAGLVLASQATLLPQPDRPLAEAAWWENVRHLSLALVGVVAAMLTIAWAFPNLPFLNRAVLRSAVAVAGPAVGVRALPEAGATGVTKTPLRPAGKVLIAGGEFDATSEAPWIDAGRPIVVVRGAGNHVIVRAADAPPRDRAT